MLRLGAQYRLWEKQQCSISLWGYSEAQWINRQLNVLHGAIDNSSRVDPDFRVAIPGGDVGQGILGSPTEKVTLLLQEVVVLWKPFAECLGKGSTPGP